MTSSYVRYFQKPWIVKCCPLIEHTGLQPFSICLDLFRNHGRHGCFAMITEIHTMPLGFENFRHQIIRQLFVNIPLLLKKLLYKIRQKTYKIREIDTLIYTLIQSSRKGLSLYQKFFVELYF